jgi:type I restriction enzyme M protein
MKNLYDDLALRVFTSNLLGQNDELVLHGGGNTSVKSVVDGEDILYVRRGSYRIGSVAMVSPFDTKVLLTREILVLRVINKENKYNIDAYYLLYLLSHKLTQLQSKNKILIETTLPNIANRWQELMLPISKDKDERKRISEQIKNVINDKWKALKRLDDLKKELGDLTT